MVASKRTATWRSARRSGAPADSQGPDVYGQLLAEAGVSTPRLASPDRPLKRRRTAQPQPKPDSHSQSDASGHDAGSAQRDESEDEEPQFQDIHLPAPTVQTLERDSGDDDSDDEEPELEDVDFMRWLSGSKQESSPEPAELELNLSAQQSSLPSAKRAGERRRPMTREEKDNRIAIHKAHVVCLLSHLARRNHWCNDDKVQDSLRPLLSDKTINYLNPGPHLPQFGRAESLKNGLKQAADVWRTKFEIRERGLRRALWAESIEQLSHYEPPVDMDSCLDRTDFREAARKLQGSRDVGAQLYCALLRSAGVRTRLVCSLQPLSCIAGGPSLPKPKGQSRLKTPIKTDDRPDTLATKRETTEDNKSTSSPGVPSARRRLGHAHAAAYNFKPASSPSRSGKSFDAPVRIRESAYPVYWVEVLDEGHQKWQPADAVVLHSFWRPNKFEPPITDKENSLCYVVAMEADGTAKDVTRRYAKAYTAKTRKLRVESAADNGSAWWRKVMKLYRQPRPTNLDQIEDNELAGAEAREPMPRNVQDFKDHPVYALERHLRRHEVLVPGATPSGTVGAGSRGPLEKVYRRRDVCVARSAVKWFRLGREVKPAEIPAKWLPKKAVSKRPRFGRESKSEDEGEGEGQEQVGTPVYRHDQTSAYEPPPVRKGRVPRNKFGNVEVYVPSMIPRGAVHIVHELAARAAATLGIDYAPALTGFQFRGRQGTAVLQGIVVASEYDEAMRAVMAGLGEAEREAADERRRLGVLAVWRRLLTGLRIRERIWSGVDEEERKEAERQAEMEAEMAEAASDATDEFDMVVEDEGEGGGFLVE